jgi:hypothetical protein
MPRKDTAKLIVQFIVNNDSPCACDRKLLEKMQLINVNLAELCRLTAGVSPTKMQELTGILKPEPPREAPAKPLNERQLLKKLQ